MESGHSNLDTFRSVVDAMGKEPSAEEFVRSFLSKVVKNCPMTVLKHLADCVASCRSDELRAELERN